MIGLSGRDVLDIIEAAERKHPGRDEMLTLLSSALSLVAMHHGISKKNLLRAVEQTYARTREVAPNTAAAGDAKQPN